MTKFSKLQLLEAGERLRAEMKANDIDPDDLRGIDLESVIDDLANYLEHPQLVSREVLLDPQLGFIPVVGEIVADDLLGNKVKFYTNGDDND